MERKRKKKGGRVIEQENGVGCKNKILFMDPHYFPAQFVSAMT